ncbi:MAG: LPD29 domain-containing protein, partial [Gaiellaceae bacterium]
MTERARYLTTNEAAKMIRADLKAAFPATKFRVYQSRGGSINVEWTDGPTTKRVDEILDKYDGKGFDGMIDLAYYIEAWILEGRIIGTRCTGTLGSMGTVSPWGLEKPHPDAELVHVSGGYHRASRKISPALATRCIAQLCTYWGGVTEIPVAVDNAPWGGYKLEPAGISNRPPRPDMGGNRTGHYYDWSDLIHQAAGDA